MPKLHVRDNPQPFSVYLYGPCERPMLWDFFALLFCVLSSLALARVANAPLRIRRAVDDSSTRTADDADSAGAPL